MSLPPMVYLMESLRAEATLMISSRGAGPLNLDLERSSLKAPIHGSVAAAFFFWLNATVQLSSRNNSRKVFMGPPYADTKYARSGFPKVTLQSAVRRWPTSENPSQ